MASGAKVRRKMYYNVSGIAEKVFFQHPGSLSGNIFENIASAAVHLGQNSFSLIEENDDGTVGRQKHDCQPRNVGDNSITLKATFEIQSAFFESILVRLADENNFVGRA